MGHCVSGKTTFSTFYCCIFFCV